MSKRNITSLLYPDQKFSEADIKGMHEHFASSSKTLECLFLLREPIVDEAYCLLDCGLRLNLNDEDCYKAWWNSAVGQLPWHYGFFKDPSGKNWFQCPFFVTKINYRKWKAKESI